MGWRNVALAVVVLAISSEAKLFLGKCNYDGFCAHKCRRVGEEFMECYCQTGYLRAPDGRRCQVAPPGYVDLTALETSGSGDLPSENCDNEGDACDGSLEATTQASGDEGDDEELDVLRSSITTTMSPSIDDHPIRPPITESSSKLDDAALSAVFDSTRREIQPVAITLTPSIPPTSEYHFDASPGEYSSSAASAWETLAESKQINHIRITQAFGTSKLAEGHFTSFRNHGSVTPLYETYSNVSMSTLDASKDILGKTASESTEPPDFWTSDSEHVIRSSKSDLETYSTKFRKSDYEIAESRTISLSENLPSSADYPLNTSRSSLSSTSARIWVSMPENNQLNSIGLSQQDGVTPASTAEIDAMLNSSTVSDNLYFRVAKSSAIFLEHSQVTKKDASSYSSIISLINELLSTPFPFEPKELGDSMKNSEQLVTASQSTRVSLLSSSALNIEETTNLLSLGAAIYATPGTSTSHAKVNSWGIVTEPALPSPAASTAPVAFEASAIEVASNQISIVEGTLVSNFPSSSIVAFTENAFKATVPVRDLEEHFDSKENISQTHNDNFILQEVKGTFTLSPTTHTISEQSHSTEGGFKGVSSTANFRLITNFYKETNLFSPSRSDPPYVNLAPEQDHTNLSSTARTKESLSFCEMHGCSCSRCIVDNGVVQCMCQGSSRSFAIRLEGCFLIIAMFLKIFLLVNFLTF